MRDKTPPSGSWTSGSEGVILLGGLIMLLTVSLIGATLASFFLSVTTLAEVELTRAQALYVAEAGVAQALHQIRQAGALGGEAEPKIPTTPLGPGSYEVVHEIGLITSTGTVRGVRRTIQVKYQPF